MPNCNIHEMTYNHVPVRKNYLRADINPYRGGVKFSELAPPSRGTTRRVCENSFQTSQRLVRTKYLSRGK